jgi:endoglucanase
MLLHRALALGGEIAVLLALLAIGLAELSPRAWSEGPPPPLQRGVNLSNWFADAERAPLTASDLEKIKSAGFDHVRIPINPEFFGFSLSEAATGRVLFDFSGIDNAVGLAREAGLAVIFDVQPLDAFMSIAEQDPQASAGFVALWSNIAEHYKTTPPTMMAFEILNEPRYAGDLSRYGAMVADIVAAIRKITPDQVIIVDVPKGASIEGFDGFASLRDPRVYYAFHFYDPYLFTHQGLTAAATRGRSVRYFHSLPYPSSGVEPKVDYAPSAPDAQEAAKEQAAYGSGGWDAARLAARIKAASDWAAANHAHVLCTEFGVVRNATLPAARYRWIEDARRALEAHGIGWTLWDYADAFGITTLSGDTYVEPSDGTVRLSDPARGSRDIEPDAVKALFQ